MRLDGAGVVDFAGSQRQQAVAAIIKDDAAVDQRATGAGSELALGLQAAAIVEDLGGNAQVACAGEHAAVCAVVAERRAGAGIERTGRLHQAAIVDVTRSARDQRAGRLHAAGVVQACRLKPHRGLRIGLHQPCSRAIVQRAVGAQVHAGAGLDQTCIVEIAAGKTHRPA